MKYILCSLLVVSLSTLSHAQPTSNEILSKVKNISNLYSDGHASLVEKSIQFKDVINPKNGLCVTLVSFFMEGFSGGNNTSQFIAFLNCQNSNKERGENTQVVKNVIGIHPFYHHKNIYDINSAKYSNKSIVIDSPSITVHFSKKHSIWWSVNKHIDN